jgi:hypothetical protein
LRADDREWVICEVLGFFKDIEEHGAVGTPRAGSSTLFFHWNGLTWVMTHCVFVGINE